MNARGFTVLELLITIVIFVVFTSIALPRYQAFQREALQQAQPKITKNCVSWTDAFFVNHYHCWKEPKS